MKEQKKWIQKALNPSTKGALRKELHVKKGEKIPLKKLEQATHSKSKVVAKRANFAKTLRGIRK